jgi:hypothetical protein
VITQKTQSTLSTPPVSTTAQNMVRRSQFNTHVLLASLKTLKGQFMLLALLSLLLCLILALTQMQSFQEASNDLNTVANGSIPSIDAAQSMAQYMEDIDAKSADYLATAPLKTLAPCSVVGYATSVGNLSVHDCDDRTITAEITQANQELYLAAHNVTYPGERTAIDRIMAGFEEYIGDIAIMRSEYSQAKNVADSQDPHMLNARHAYQQANSVLNQHINQLPLSNPNGSPRFAETNIPTCQENGQTLAPQTWALSSIHTNLDCLSGINKAHLDAAYNQATSQMGSNLFFAIVGNVVLWLLLGYTMLRMTLITHRLVNLGLVLALAGSLILGIGVISHFAQLSGPHGDFSQMVNDDYNSVYDAALLKRYGTDANADESRWLIALEYNDQQDADHWAQDWRNNTAQVRTLISNAQKNQTWPEEIQPLAAMQANWQKYYSIDGTIRSAATNMSDPQRILTAERISTGISNNTFGKFTDAIDALSQANRTHFNQTLQDTSSYLSFFMLACVIILPVLGLCAVWGVYQRLKDF